MASESLMPNLADQFVRFLAASKDGRIMRMVKVPPKELRTPRDIPRDTFIPCPTKIDPAPVFWVPADLHMGTIYDGRSKFTMDQAAEMLEEATALVAHDRLTLPYPECYFAYTIAIISPMTISAEGISRQVVLTRCRQPEQGGPLTVEGFHDEVHRFTRNYVTRCTVMKRVSKDGMQDIRLFEMSDDLFTVEEAQAYDMLRSTLHALVWLSRQHEVRISDIDPPTNRYLARNSTRKPLQRMVEVDLSAVQWRMQHDPKEHPSGRVQSPHDRRGHVRHHRDGRTSLIPPAKIKGGAEVLRHYAVKHHQQNLRP